MPYLTSNTNELANPPLVAWEGRAAGVDADGIQRNLLWSPRFITKTAAYTVLAKETGTWFLNTGSTAAVTFTLPGISDGPYIFFFVVVADLAVTVAAAVADTMLTFNDAAADSVGFATASEMMGSLIIAGCDGTTVFGLTPIMSDIQTVTVTTA